MPLECYERGTTSAGLASTHERQCLVGSESGLTWAGRSTSCTRWRLLDNILLDALANPSISDLSWLGTLKWSSVALTWPRKRTIGSAARPSRLVVRAALRVRQDLARLEMGEQVHEAHLAARALDLGRCRAHRRLVGAAPGEERAQPRLGIQQPRALRA